MEHTFYAVVAQGDINAEEALAKGYDPPRGPILFECYLTEESKDPAKVAEVAKRFSRYGWTRVAKVTVEIP